MSKVTAFLLVGMAFLSCSLKSVRTAPILALFLSVSANAGTFTAEWTISTADSVDLDYALYLGSVSPSTDPCTPTLKLWSGRAPIVTGKMLKTVTFAETLVVAGADQRVCFHVNATSRLTSKTSANSNPASVVGDFTPPPPPGPTGLTINYQP